MVRASNPEHMTKKITNLLYRGAKNQFARLSHRAVFILK
jgi:hypothetical protein